MKLKTKKSILKQKVKLIKIQRINNNHKKNMNKKKYFYQIKSQSHLKVLMKIKILKITKFMIKIKKII